MIAIALLVGAAAGLLAATQPVSDTDLFWHLATGRETLAHGIVRTDVFSWTVRGEAVSADQWLGQVLLYGAYLAGGWKGIAIVRVVAVVALLTLVVANAAAGRAVRPLAAVLASVPALVLTRAVWVDRPELLGFAFFTALLLLLRLGRGGNDRALAGVVALIVVWANVHGSFALGVVLLVLAAAEGALRDRPRRTRYLIAAVAGMLASLLTPSGAGTWTAPGLHLLSPPRGIQEWALIDVTTPLGLAYAVTLALVIACALWGPRPDPRELVVLVPVAALSLTAARQTPLLAIAAAPLFAAAAERALALRGARATGTLSTRGAAVASLLALLPPAGLLAAALAIAPASADERPYPVGALAALPRGDGVLARYEWGGWLIWRAPGTPVYVDGRLVPYLGPVLDDYRRILTAAPDWRDAIARRGVRALLVTPADPVAVRARELGWNEIATGETFVLIAVP